MAGAVVLPSRIAVMAVDPGRTTGLAVVTCPSLSGTLADCFAGAEELRAWEVGGDLVAQVQTITDSWQLFFALTRLKGYGEGEVRLVVESFQLRTVHADLAPVELIGGLRVGLGCRCPSLPAPRWQTPADAKRTMTDARLRKVGGWTVGSAHARDAVRHLGVAVSRAMDGD